MGFRTLEISSESEIHIKESQLIVSTEKGVVSIPIEDLQIILTHGANIRLSTMDLSILSLNKVALVTLDDKYLPTAIVLPFEGNSRQSKMVHAQAAMSDAQRLSLWKQIISQKISNQARLLSILGTTGPEVLMNHLNLLTSENVNYIEAMAAKDYFVFYHKGLNRRADDPINSRLNYGYAVVRSAIARSLVATGFHPAFGLQHHSQLNAFNLADDLIEPYRAIVDLVVDKNIGTSLFLSKSECKEIASVLHKACKINGTKMSVMSAIDEMCESLKRIVLDNSVEQLKLPVILPLEQIGGITE